MNKLFIASLLTLSATALATPTPPTPPPSPAPTRMPAHFCDKSGGVLFEEKLAPEARVEANVFNEATWTITVYAGGAWERHDLKPGNKVAGLSEGCLANDQLATIKDSLAKATWTVNHHDFACAAIGTTFTSYSVRGKQVWDVHMCQTAYLDETSEKAIQTIGKLLETVTAPHNPPCCKK